MGTELDSSIADLLARVRDGEAGAADRLFQLVHGELRAMARRHMRKQPPGHTLQTSALVNEAFLRLADRGWRDKEHFFAVASSAMRSVLVDHARRRERLKRTPTGRRVPLDDLTDAYELRSRGLVALDAALERLAACDPNAAKVIELRFFAGLTMEQAAATMGVSLRTTERDWKAARAWLRQAVR